MDVDWDSISSFREFQNYMIKKVMMSMCWGNVKSIKKKKH